MTRRLEELASLFEDKVGANKKGLLKIVTEIKAEKDRPKYEELLKRAQDVGPGVKTESFIERASKDVSALERAHSEINWGKMKKEAQGRKKVKVSRKKVIKDINDNRVKYRDYRSSLSNLEREKEKLDAMIQSAKDGVHKTRKDMLFLSDVLQTLNLADSNYAIFYENDQQDVSYILDKSKEEYHVKFEDGELIITPWKDYMRNMRINRKLETGENLLSPEGDEALEEEDFDLEESEEDEENDDVADSDFLPGADRLDDGDPRSEDATITGYPNLRFVE